MRSEVPTHFSTWEGARVSLLVVQIQLSGFGIGKIDRESI